MPTTLLRSVPPSSPHRRAVAIILAVAAAAAALSVAIFLAPRLVGPAHVAAVTVDNPTAYALDVELVAEEGASTMGVGRVPAGSASTFHQIIDHGSRWTFRFSYAGEVGGTVSVPRRQLEQDGWTVDVPPSVARELRAAGIEPAP